MKIYLLRHAIAVTRGTEGYPNDDRPLTEEGAERMVKGARGITSLVPGFDVFLTSPLIRARETAKITAKAFNGEAQIEECKHLLPGSSVTNLFSFLAKYKAQKRVLLVGHEPDMGYIASALLFSETSVIEFKKGGLCCIDVSDMPPKEPGTLRWHVTPRQLRMFAKK